MFTKKYAVQVNLVGISTGIEYKKYLPMCIICNCHEEGNDFLADYWTAENAMKKAIKSMESCYEVSKMKKYRRTQYRMVRILKEWHKIDGTREDVVV